MWKNPANYNGDLSDYNLLKNQKDNGEIIREIKRKYDKKPLTIPTEDYKYYEYLTYKQSILDEINFISDKMTNEDLIKQKENYDFLMKIKEQREELMKKKRQHIETQTEIDYTPNITTTQEFIDNNDNEINSILSNENTIINNSLIELPETSIEFYKSGEKKGQIKKKSMNI